MSHICCGLRQDGVRSGRITGVTNLTEGRGDTGDLLPFFKNGIFNLQLRLYKALSEQV